MRILLIHPNELEEYHLERIVTDCLVDLGHSVSHVRYRGVDGSTVASSIYSHSRQTDFALVLKGDGLDERHYRAIRCYSGLWYVDHPREDRIPGWLALGCANVDIVYASSYGLLDALRRYNPRVRWLVEGAHLPLLEPVDREPEYDLSFFGTLRAETNDGDVFGERWAFLADLADRYDLHLWGPDSDRSFEREGQPYRFRNAHEPVWNDKLADAIGCTRIVIGYNSTNRVHLYWSNRVYVTLACRGFLITPYVPGMERVFRNHDELVWYHSLDELHEFVDYYLQRPGQRREIAEQGHRKVCARFSTRSQVEALLQMAGETLPLGKSKPGILFVTDLGYPGCASAARQWSALLRQEGVRTEAIEVDSPPDPSIMDAYDVTVLNGYSGLYRPLLDRHDCVKYFAWYSSILQTELENETGAVRRIVKAASEDRVAGVICSDESTLTLFPCSVWIPLVSVFDLPASERRFRIDGKVNISALGPAKARKNLYTVLAALEHLSDSYVVHLNLPPDYFEEKIAGVFDTSKIVNHGWLSSEDYHALVRDCDVGVQLSVGESYNYVAAEHNLLDTPMICSANVPAAAHPDLVVRDFENAGELIARIDRVLRADEATREKWFERFRQENTVRSEQAVRRFKRRVLHMRAVAPTLVMNAGRPPLTIVYHGRNDDYGGNFSRRLAWSLSTVQRAFASLAPEIIFVNWNTLPGSPSLFDDPLFADLRAGINAYFVPASVHREIAARAGYTGVYLEWYAKNFGVRRSKGEFILQLNSDNLILDEFTGDMLPDFESTLLAPRTEVDAKVLQMPPEALTHESVAPLTGRRWGPDIDRPYFVGGPCGEFVLTHRSHWHRICGNVETTDRWCIDNVTATHLRRVSELELLPFPVYHISHARSDGVWPGFEFELGYSGENWGLADYPLEPVIY